MKNNKASVGSARPPRNATVKPTGAPEAPLEWPFVERRATDRRQRDRRQARVKAEPVTASPLCTTREQQVLLLVVQGLTNKEIARRLRIAEDTVKKHLQHVYRKLGIQRRTLLILEQVGRLERSVSVNARL